MIIFQDFDTLASVVRKLGGPLTFEMLLLASGSKRIKSQAMQN